MTEVKPCPFCGTADVTVQPGSTFRWWVAACSSCGAQSGEVRVQTMGDGTPAECSPWFTFEHRRALA